MKIETNVKNIKISSKPIKTPFERLPWPRCAADDPNIQLGVDIKVRMDEIIKIVHKFFHVQDISMQELLQEVYVTIEHKNKTRSAHDPRKSSFGHYIYMIANNVCINFIHKKKRYDKEKDSIDAPIKDKNTSRPLLETKEYCAIINDDNDILECMKNIEDIMMREGKYELARYIRAVKTGASADIIREALSWGDRKLGNKEIRNIRYELREEVKYLLDDDQSSGFQCDNISIY